MLNGNISNLQYFKLILIEWRYGWNLLHLNIAISTLIACKPSNVEMLIIRNLFYLLLFVKLSAAIDNFFHYTVTFTGISFLESGAHSYLSHIPFKKDGRKYSLLAAIQSLLEPSLFMIFIWSLISRLVR